MLRVVSFCLISSLLVESEVMAAPEPAWFFACAADNDLYGGARDNGLEVARFDEPTRALQAAPSGGAVLILADGYPTRTTTLGPEDFRIASQKKLRLYVEYPAQLPDITAGKPRRVKLERAVVTSAAFAPALDKLDLIAIHDYTYRDAGRELGYSERQARYRYGLIVDRLVRCLRKRGIHRLEDLL